MKMDIKTLAIIILVGIIGIMAGIIIGREEPIIKATPVAPQRPTPTAGVPADGGKLAKEYKKNEIMKVIRENAKIIQKCYLDYLDKKPEITEGVLRFNISLGEDGSVISSKVTKNEFNNSVFSDCTNEKIANLHFAPPPLGINRNISHELAFKSEETVKKEAEEAKKKNALPKILPVTPEQVKQ